MWFEYFIIKIKVLNYWHEIEGLCLWLCMADVFFFWLLWFCRGFHKFCSQKKKDRLDLRSSGIQHSRHGQSCIFIFLWYFLPSLSSFLPCFLPSFLPFKLFLTSPLSLSVGPRADSTQTLLSCLGLGKLSVWPLPGPNRHWVLSKLQLLINRVGWWGQVIAQAIAGSIWHQPNCHKQSASFLYPHY